MTWDLRSKYAFDASEGQIPEGAASVYGPANSHANCVPASFTAALDLAGFGDIDPQRLTNEIYGPNYRGGFGDFSRTIGWIRANIANAPAFSDGPFDFSAADAAGQNGQLIIIAGWVDAATVTFVPDVLAQGFSHASLLAGHLANDQWLIWNTWTGQMQTYSRTVLAASLYEMSVMAPAQGEDMTPEQEAKVDALATDVKAVVHAMFYGTGTPNVDPSTNITWGAIKGFAALYEARMKAIVPAGNVTVDNTAVLAAIADLKAHPATADPAVLALVQKIEKALQSA